MAAYLSHRDILTAAETFHNAVEQSPYKCKIRIFAVDSDSLGYESVVGDSSRTSQDFELCCLFTRVFNEYSRQKYGLREDESAVVYLSQKQLKAATGSDRLPGTRYEVCVNGFWYLPSRVVYQGENDKFSGVYVAAEIRLQEKSRAGD